MIKRVIVQHTVVFVFFLLLAILFTYPGIIRMSTHIIGDGVDTIEYYSYFYAVKENLLHGKPPLWPTDTYRYPIGVNTSLSDGRIFVVLGGLLSFILPGVTAYNVLLLFFFVLNAYAAYYFCRTITSRYDLGLLGGVLYGFSTWVIMNGYGAINVFLMFSFPLLGAILVSIIKNGITSASPYRFVLGMYLVALSSAEGLMLGAISLVIDGLLVIILLPKTAYRLLQTGKKQVWHVINAAAIFIGALYITFPHHVQRLLSEDFPSSGALFATPPFPLSAFFIPPINNYKSLLTSVAANLGVQFPYVSWWNETLYIGVPVFVLLFMAVLGFRKSKWLQLALVSTALYFGIIISGLFYRNTPFPGIPFWLLYPFVYITDHYDYFIMLFWVYAMIAIVLGLKTLQTKRWFVYGAILLLCVERVNLGYPGVDASFLHGKSYANVVASLPGKAVLDIPIDTYTGYNLLPYQYRKPIVGGMVHWFGDGSRERSFVGQPDVARFACGLDPWYTFPTNHMVPIDYEKSKELNYVFASRMKDEGIDTVVIHKKWYYREQCATVREQVAMQFSGLTKDEAGVHDDVWAEINRHADGAGAVRFIRIFDNADVIIYQLDRTAEK